MGHTDSCSEDGENSKTKVDSVKKQQYITLIICLSLTVVSAVQMGIGLWASRMVANIAAGSFWASSLVVIGVLVASVGVCSARRGQCAMLSGIAFLVLGLAVVTIGAIIDGFAAKAIMDIDFSQCSHSTLGYANCTHLFPCHVQLAWPDVCYCCHLTGMREEQCYFRHVGLTHSPSIFAGVPSCDHVEGQYVNLLWSSVALCMLCFIMTIVGMMAVCFFKTKMSSVHRKYTPPAVNTIKEIEPTPSSPPVSSATTYAFPQQSPEVPQPVLHQTPPTVITHVRESITTHLPVYQPTVVTTTVPYTVSSAPPYQHTMPPPGYM